MKNIKYGLLMVLLISSIQATRLGEMIFAYEEAVEERPKPEVDRFSNDLIQPTEEETAPADALIREKLEEISRELARGNVDPNQPFADGTLPLGHAASINLHDLVRVLVENGANVFAKDARGRTTVSHSFSSDLERRAYSKSTRYLAEIMGISGELPEHPGPLRGQIKILRYVRDFDRIVDAYISTLQEAKCLVIRRPLMPSKKMPGICHDVHRYRRAVKESLDRARARTIELLVREEKARAAAEDENFLPICMLPW